jgi:APA family basic amino acid/polyamine antiporter
MKLKRTFGLWSTVSIVIGGIIGSGIFMKPALMASQVGSPIILVSIWICAGVITLLGALTNAEVAAMLPETGGQYIFFQKMYGDFIAFLYGWAAFAVFNTAGVASIAYVLATYTGYFIKLPRLPKETEQLVYLFIPAIGKIYPLQNLGVKSLTILVVAGLTIVNYHSTQAGGRIQVIFTALKIGAMGFLIF